MDIRGKKFLLIGGAGLIGSHTVDALLREDVAEIRIFDNFTRGSRENLEEALRDPRVRIFELGGDILHRDILDQAMKDIDGVFHLAKTNNHRREKQQRQGDPEPSQTRFRFSRRAGRSGAILRFFGQYILIL